MLQPLPVAILVTAAVLLLMLVELQLSWFNEKALRAKGAVEPAGDVIRWMAIAYPAAFVSMGVEAALGGPLSRTWIVTGLLLFGWAKALKFWAMTHLGARWTFRVLVLPGASLVASGPYRFVRHPNYIAVMGEIVIPDTEEMPTEWREAVTMVAHRTRDTLRRHPWILQPTVGVTVTGL